MAKRNLVFGVQFNDNDGAAGFFSHSEGNYDYKRHVRIMGRWRAFWFFVRLSFRAVQIAHAMNTDGTEPRWKRLRGWKP